MRQKSFLLQTLLKNLSDATFELELRYLKFCKSGVSSNIIFVRPTIVLVNFLHGLAWNRINIIFLSLNFSAPLFLFLLLLPSFLELLN